MIAVSSAGMLDIEVTSVLYDQGLIKLPRLRCQTKTLPGSEIWENAMNAGWLPVKGSGR